MKPKKLEFLSPQEVERFRSHTLEILENTGIKVTLKKMRDLLGERHWRRPLSRIFASADIDVPFLVLRCWLICSKPCRSEELRNLVGNQ